MKGECYRCTEYTKLVCWFCKKLVCNTHSSRVDYKYGALGQTMPRGTYIRRACGSCKTIHRANIRIKE